jgi:hypothetical protein
LKTRVEAGTDIAAIGAWDASRDDSALAKVGASAQGEALERDAAEGRLFFVRIGADWGGPVDVYVGEELPAEVRQNFKQVGGEYLLSVATGRLVIDGLEFYRTGKANDVLADNTLKIQAGDYALRFFESKLEDEIDSPTRKDVERLVGAKDGAWFQRLQWWVLAMYMVVPVVFFAVRHFSGWITALLMALMFAGVASVVYSMIKGTARFKRVAKAQYDLWRQAKDRQSPVFVFVLRKKKEGEGLKGGWVKLQGQRAQ